MQHDHGEMEGLWWKIKPRQQVLMGITGESSFSLSKMKMQAA
jgi:hypothetical protein